MDLQSRINYVAEHLGVQPAEVKNRLDNAKEDKTIPSDKANIAAHVDFTVLNAFATKADIVTLCQKAKQYHTISVCVNPNRVAVCKEELKGSGIKIASVVGFPLGASTSAPKAFEAHSAVEEGADDLEAQDGAGAAARCGYRRTAQADPGQQGGCRLLGRDHQSEAPRRGRFGEEIPRQHGRDFGCARSAGDLDLRG